ncbi:MAG: sulfite exporter TauE/SafE family protein [Clostridium sp.]|nr:sulfite exporter TauE/SafE family protein [Clostridium sp.]
MPVQTIVIIGAVYLFATCIQRICGFGMGILAVMILPYFTGSHVHSAAYTNILSALSASYLTWRYRDKVRWRLIFPILCGSFLATFLSVRFLSGASFELLEKILGGTLLLLSVYFLFLKGKLRVPPDPQYGFLAGCLGGIANGLFGAGGPPVVLYLLGATEGHAAYLATIQGYFAFNNIYATIVRFLSGQLTPELLTGLFGALPAMVAGIRLGDLIAPYLPDKAILKAIYLLMMVSGIQMLL